MRYHGPLLHLMTEVLERGRSGVLPFVQAVLRLGLTDLPLLETLPHAAVSSTVNLLGTRATSRYRGMVNAVPAGPTGSGLIFSISCAPSR